MLFSRQAPSCWWRHVCTPGIAVLADLVTVPTRYKQRNARQDKSSFYNVQHRAVVVQIQRISQQRDYAGKVAD